MTNTTNDITLPAAEIEKMVAVAEERGTEDGKGAGSWVRIDSEEAACRAIQLNDDGDPCFDEEIGYHSPLSGEFSDDFTPRSLITELGAPEYLNEFQSLEIQDAYADSHRTAYVDEVIRMALAYLD
jgi:hypothetical protein